MDLNQDNALSKAGRERHPAKQLELSEVPGKSAAA